MTNKTLQRTRHTSRASFACYRCKKAKRRCDISQQSPGPATSCSTCQERNEKCDFRGRGEDKRKQRQGARALQARVAMLERELGIRISQQESNSNSAEQVDEGHEEPWQATESASWSSHTGWDVGTPSKPAETAERMEASVDARLSPIPSPGARTSPSSTTSVHQVTPDIAGCINTERSEAAREYTNDSKESRRFPIGMDEVTPQSGDLEQDEYGNERYLGASSMFPYGDMQPSSAQDHHDVAHYLARKADISPSSLEDFTEPEPIVSHLLDLFWTYQASHLLIVDRGIFLHYRQLARKSNGIGDRNYYTPCLLYSMLALASLISTDKGVKRYSSAGGIPGDLFNQRARVLFDMEMERPTVTTAQAAILIGSRYGTFVDNSLGWIFSGIALRVVTKLGLHLDCSRMVASKRMTEEEARYRSIAFWGSYIEDRLYSAYCQRPMMLMDWDITISPPPDQPLNSPYISCHLLPHTVLLSQICGRILLGLYAQRHLHRSGDGQKKIAFEIHGQLWEWQQKLPEDLVYPAASKSRPSPPSVLVLHMQFYYNLILVHRPLLEFSKVREELSQARNPAQATSTTTCAIAAANIAKLVSDYQEQYDIRQITPNGVHIIFIAATIHLINYRLTSCDSHGQLFWGCVKALDQLADSYPMAQKAVHILNELIQRFRPLGSPSPSSQPDGKAERPELTDGKSRQPLNMKERSHGRMGSTSSSPAIEMASRGPSQTGLLWTAPPNAYSGLSYPMDVPLEIPQPMDVEGFIDAAGSEMTFCQQTIPEENAMAGFNFPEIPGDFHLLDQPSVYASEAGGGLSLLNMWGDQSGSISPSVKNRNLFDTFYGKAVGLY